MKDLIHPDFENINLPQILYALGDPARLKIVKGIFENGEKCCNAFDIPLAKNTLSHHFKVLRESGVISVTCKGTKRLLKIRKEELDKKFPGLLDSILSNYIGNSAE